MRRFKALNSLTLEGNPLSTAENYKSYTIALLSCLVYLDYSIIDENMVVKIEFHIYYKLFNKKISRIICFDNLQKEDARHTYEMDIEKLEEADVEADILQRSSKENFLALEKAFCDALFSMICILMAQLILIKFKQEAFVDKVKGSFIMEVMFANDEEGKLLSNIPPNKTALDEYAFVEQINL